MPADVDMQRIYQIESSGNPNAYNRKSQARGLGQVTPVALQEYNKMNKAAVQPDQLFVPQVNHQISHWYMNKRVPQMLNAMGIQDTVDNRLAAYNAGAGSLRKVLRGQMDMPKETSDYLVKYKKAKKEK